MGNDSSVHVSGKNNEITFFVPTNGTKTFYGISGNQTTKESTEELYQSSVQTSVKLEVEPIYFVFALDGMSADYSNNVVTVGQSTYKFAFEGAYALSCERDSDSLRCSAQR